MLHSFAPVASFVVSVIASVLPFFVNVTLSIPFVSDALPLTFRLPLPPAPRLLLFRLPDSGTPPAQFTSGTLLSALKPLVSAVVVLFPALSVARTQIL